LRFVASRTTALRLVLYRLATKDLIMHRAIFDQQAVVQALSEYLNVRDRDHPKEGQLARLEIRHSEAILTWEEKDASTRTP
jgi:hypothetical protein